jgi:SAM-dependent methyltransferase
MRETTANRLQPFGSRASVAAFDIHQSDWYHHLDGADCVVSSLCIHHLDGDEKQALFSAVGSRLTPRGAFLIADLIRPQRVEARRLFAATWDRAAQAQSIEQTGSPALFKLFNDEHWNWFHYPDPFDKPSPLADQLTWLRAAGLAAADCFWMNAGHAIYGGYQSASEAPSSDPLSFDAALAAARRALL